MRTRLLTLTLICALSCSIAGHTAPLHDRTAITAAVSAYVRVPKNGGMAHVRVQKITETGSYARAMVLPVGVETDPATAYLKRQNGHWRVIAFGTGLSPSEMKRLGIPTGLR